MKTCLLTGAAGFIGFHLSEELLARGYRVVGLDNLNDYYEIALKRERLERLSVHRRFAFIEADIADEELLDSAFLEHRPSLVVNLAAQAGVRYSIDNPRAYITSNVLGFFNILEACRHHPVEHLVYASSSSVYGGNEEVPFRETDKVSTPVSLYAATKLADEVMAHAYSHLYGIAATGLRFFTVYGPWGRPDMAYFSFLDKHFAGQHISIYNDGVFEKDLSRDFTFVGDIVEAVARLLEKPPDTDVPHVVYNIGNHQPIKLMVFIETLERCLSLSLGRPESFRKVYESLKPGDVPATFASVERLNEAIGFQPSTSLEAGLQAFTDWYVRFRGLARD